MFTGHNDCMNMWRDAIYFRRELRGKFLTISMPLLNSVDAVIAEKVIELVVANTQSRYSLIIGLACTLNKVVPSLLQLSPVVVEKLMDRCGPGLLGTDMNNGFQVKLPLTTQPI